MARARRASPPRVIWHWGIDTAHFRFDAYGESAEECARVMRHGWDRHRQRTGASLTWAEVESGAPHAVGLGECYRDGELFLKFREEQRIAIRLTGD